MSNEDKQTDVAALRREYQKNKLDENAVQVSPVKQFHKWLDEAISSQIYDPTVMILSTVSNGNKPSSRVVLLKGYQEEQFLFFTNYQSRKGLEIDKNPNVALNFYWPELERQVRIEGEVRKTDAKTSDEYFHSRPRLSQIGAWASEQSQKIPSREVLEKSKSHYETKFADRDVPRPSYWGGYLVKPNFFEFWQGREGRLHDRISYRKDGAKWIIERLSP